MLNYYPVNALTMITKTEARKIALNYLSEKNRNYIRIAKPKDVIYGVSKKMLFGENEGKRMDVYAVEYIVAWGWDEKKHWIYIDAKSGVVQYTIGPLTWVEEWEDTDMDDEDWENTEADDEWDDSETDDSIETRDTLESSEAE